MSLFCTSALSQTLPGPADVGRITPLEIPFVPQTAPAPSAVPQILPDTNIPQTAKDVMIRIDHVNIEGVTAFTQEQLTDIYAPHLGKEVPLDTLWAIAGQLTERYRAAGYFLSRAFVPAQEIEDGSITLKVVEGYAGEVKLEGIAEPSGIVKAYMEELRTVRPLSAAALESIVMKLNDLPGMNVTAYVDVLKNAPPGAVMLVLEPMDKGGRGSISFDNYGSRFLGPYQAMVTYQDSFIPLQQTTVSVLTSLPSDELRYGALRHRVPVAPDWSLELSGSYVTSQPGASLEASDINSSSIELGLGLNWQVMRQRQENLSLSLNLDGKNTNGDILDNNPLTRDRIRSATLLIDYDTNDNWNGYNYLNATITQGLDILGSSSKGDLNLSRAQAEPDFTTLSASYIRLQSLGTDWLAVGQLSGQAASDPLFSAQEFGYGGSRFGRAYDGSEITGDHGVAASLELRYQSLSIWPELRTIPYAFYDIGKVWNEDAGGQPESASSAGFGVRLNYEAGISGNLGLAWPLTKDIDTPIYGGRDDPRIILQVGLEF